jgi:hypothetical protein
MEYKQEDNVMARQKLSMNEKIRRAFRRGEARASIAKRFRVPYQTVYKATSVRFASKAFREELLAAQTPTVEVEAPAVEA